MYKYKIIVKNINKGGQMNTLYKIALSLIIIGALNWGMIGIFDVNLVSLIFGTDTFMTNLVYALVGISGLISCGILMQPLDEYSRQRIVRENR